MFWGCPSPGDLGVQPLVCTFVQWPLEAYPLRHQDHRPLKLEWEESWGWGWERREVEMV